MHVDSHCHVDLLWMVPLISSALLARMNNAAARTATRFFRCVKCFEERRQVVDDALYLQLDAMNALPACIAIPLESIHYAVRTLTLYHEAGASRLWPLGRVTYVRRQ